MPRKEARGMTIEDMEKEVYESGYKFTEFAIEGLFDFAVKVHAPNNWEYVAHNRGGWKDLNTLKTILRPKAIEAAYAHLEKERQFAAQAQEIAALREHLKNIIQGANKGWTVDRMRRYAVEVLQGIVKREDGE